jgi:hypothetical protein
VAACLCDECVTMDKGSARKDTLPHNAGFRSPLTHVERNTNLENLLLVCRSGWLMRFQLPVVAVVALGAGVLLGATIAFSVGAEPFERAPLHTLHLRARDSWNLTATGAPPGVDEDQWRTVLAVLQQYAATHSQASPALVWTCEKDDVCGGFSDRVRGMWGALMLSVATSRRLLLRSQRPVLLEEVFDQGAIDWRSDGRPLFAPVLSLLSKIDWDATSGTIRDALASPDDVYLRTNYFLLQEHMDVLLGPRSSSKAVQAMLSIPLSVADALTFHFLFKPKSSLPQDTTTVLLELARRWSGRLMALHIRSGDGSMTQASDSRAIDLDSIIQSIVLTTEQCGPFSLYIASDSVEIAGKVAARLPPTVQPLLCCSRAIHIDKHSAATDSPKNEMMTAIDQILTDYWMFSHSKAVVAVGGGWYAHAGSSWSLEQQATMLMLPPGDFEPRVFPLC